MSAAVDPTLSDVVGSTEPPLSDLTIGALLGEAAWRWGPAEALVSVAEGVRLTFAELDLAASALAAGLLGLGLARGDRVGIWSPNNAAWIVVQYAAARAGLVLVTINPAYRVAELEHALRLVGVRAVIAAERFRTSDYLEMLEELAPEIAAAGPGGLSSARLPDLRYAIKLEGPPRAGWIDLADLRVEQMLKETVADDPVNIQFTSGTTGLPKGATLTHRNIVNNATMVGAATGLDPGDRVCVPVPLYHCFGMVMASLACVARGATIVLPSPGFGAEVTLAAASAERCTHLYGVPTMFVAMLEETGIDGLDLSRLRGGIMAGAPCPVETMRAVMARLNMAEVTIAYGMTETSPVSFQTARNDATEQRVATVGRVQPHLECKLVDADGATVPRGAVGELCTRGYSVMRGYWGEPERTAEVIDADGWMHTGDLATFDDQGYCRIVGRVKDMVIRGGENIYPAEVEAFLQHHPAVAEAAVVGVPDARFGEELCAWIRLKPDAATTPEDIAAFCRGRIAHYKVPRHVRLVEALPMTVTGKVQKFVIREAMARELAEAR